MQIATFSLLIFALYLSGCLQVASSEKVPTESEPHAVLSTIEPTSIPTYPARGDRSQSLVYWVPDPWQYVTPTPVPPGPHRNGVLSARVQSSCGPQMNRNIISGRSNGVYVAVVRGMTTCPHYANAEWELKNRELTVNFITIAENPALCKDCTGNAHYSAVLPVYNRVDAVHVSFNNEPLVSQSSEGMACGGVTSLLCPSGYTCLHHLGVPASGYGECVVPK